MGDGFQQVQVACRPSDNFIQVRSFPLPLLLRSRILSADAWRADLQRDGDVPILEDIHGHDRRPEAALVRVRWDTRCAALPSGTPLPLSLLRSRDRN